MTVRLNTNQASMNAQRRLGEVSSSLGKTFERLSSGMRVNRASDDAAGLAVASNLNFDARVYAQGVKNLNDGVSMLRIASGALEQLSDITIRISELAQQSSNGVLSSKQRQSLDKEAQALRTEFNRILASTSLNNRVIFADDAETVRLQAGYGDSASLDVEFGQSLSREVGSGSFGTPIVTGGYTGGLGDTGDVNGDGKVDVVFGHAFPTFKIRLGNGDGTFKADHDSGWTYDWTFTVQLVDMDGDGDLDILGSTFNGSTGAVIAFNDGSGSFSTVRSFAVGSGAPEMNARAGDFNGDGIVDFATLGFATSDVGIFYGTGGGNFAARQEIQDVAYAGGGRYALSIGDFNHDGLDDIAAGDAANTRILLANSNNTFKVGDLYAINNVHVAMDQGDFNADGNIDLIQIGDGGGGGARILLGRGDGTFQISSLITGTSGQLRSVSVGDLNEDGLDDFIFGADTTSIIALGNGDGTFRQSTGTSGYAFLDDIDQDGVLDAIRGNAVVQLGESTLTTRMREFSLLTQSSALEALGISKETLERVVKESALIGALESRIITQLSNLKVVSENYLSAASQILDADVAMESSELVRKQILQSSAQAVLSQANQLPQLALRLLQGGF